MDGVELPPIGNTSSPLEGLIWVGGSILAMFILSYFLHGIYVRMEGKFGWGQAPETNPKDFKSYQSTSGEKIFLILIQPFIIGLYFWLFTNLPHEKFLGTHNQDGAPYLYTTNWRRYVMTVLLFLFLVLIGPSISAVFNVKRQDWREFWLRLMRRSGGIGCGVRKNSTERTNETADNASDDDGDHNIRRRASKDRC